MVVSIDDVYEDLVNKDQLAGWQAMAKINSRQELANRLCDYHLEQHEELKNEVEGGVSGALDEIIRNMIINADWLSLAIRIRNEVDALTTTQSPEQESNVIPVNFGK